VGPETDAVKQELFAALSEEPYAFDFYQTMRRLECALYKRVNGSPEDNPVYELAPRWGEARRPADEAIRFGQEPELTFPPAPLSSFQQLPPPKGKGVPRLNVRLFGLLGPNGPMPLHITEYARERRQVNDYSLCRFLDVFQHRFITLFYRAWAQAQPHVNRDRPDDDRFAMYIAAMFGLAPEAFRNRDAVPDTAKLFHVGALVRHARNADGLRAILEHFCKVPVQIEEFVGHWMALGPRERTYLGREGATLSRGAVAGKRVWDRQYKFRVRIGPLTFSQYEAFLPGGTLIQKLVDWVRLYLGFELEWDVRLLLVRDKVPPLVLGRSGRLGWTTWLGQRKAATDADDLCFVAEAFVGRAGAAVI
jgi:type VI secretion system protein ImpH